MIPQQIHDQIIRLAADKLMQWASEESAYRKAHPVRAFLRRIFRIRPGRLGNTLETA